MPRTRPFKGQLWRSSGGFCTYCKRKMRRSMRKRGQRQAADLFTVDHVVPECEGGVTEIDNLVACCFRCNDIKGDGTVAELLKFLYDIGVFKEGQK